MRSTLDSFHIPASREWIFVPTAEDGPGLLDLYGNRSLRLILLFELYAWTAIVVMRTSLDPDIWWHLQAGRWVVEHAAVPQTDPFSAFGQGKPWLAYSWLFEVLVYGLYLGLGMAGVVLYRAVMGFLVAGVVHGFVVKGNLRLLPTTGLVGVSLLSSCELMNERPWMFTILVSILTLDLVLDLRAGRERRDLWLLPVVYAVWANIHIQFIYGLFVLGLACAAPWLDRLPWFAAPGGPAARAGTAAWRRLAAVTAACAAGDAAQPLPRPDLQGRFRIRDPDGDE